MFRNFGIQEIIVLFVIAGVFLLAREVVLWYWKINKIVENQETQIQLLKELVANAKAASIRERQNMD